jgi:hypothetical protein
LILPLARATLRGSCPLFNEPPHLFSAIVALTGLAAAGCLKAFREARLKPAETGLSWERIHQLKLVADADAG